MLWGCSLAGDVHASLAVMYVHASLGVMYVHASLGVMYVHASLGVMYVRGIVVKSVSCNIRRSEYNKCEVYECEFWGICQYIFYHYIGACIRTMVLLL